MPSTTVCAIAGAAGGVAAVVVLILFYILRRRNRVQGRYGGHRDGIFGEGNSDGAAYPAGAMRSLGQAYEYQPRPFALDDLGPDSWAVRGFTPPQKTYESPGGSSSVQTLQSGGTSSGGVSVPRNDDGPSFPAPRGSVQELEATIDIPPAYDVDLRRGRVTT